MASEIVLRAGLLIAPGRPPAAPRPRRTTRSRAAGRWSRRCAVNVMRSAGPARARMPARRHSARSTTRIDLDAFTDRLREGLQSTHADMPSFRFSRDDARAVVAYLRSIQGPVGRAGIVPDIARIPRHSAGLAGFQSNPLARPERREPRPAGKRPTGTCEVPMNRPWLPAPRPADPTTPFGARLRPAIS